MKSKSAIVFGATGLIGSRLVLNLLHDRRYYKVRIFVRREASFPSSEKLEKFVVEISSPERYAGLITGHHLFCCLGTTISKAKSKTAFRQVDYELPVNLAKVARENGLEKFLVVSSVGANTNSGNFYLKTKGEMERDVKHTFSEGLAILRPSLLVGDRKELRIGESAGKMFMSIINPLLVGALKKYRSIQANDVAKAMMEIASGSFKETIFESDKIQEIAVRAIL